MKVSIIIPVFNESSTVEELLKKVCAQEVCGLTKELVIVESNSTDGSRERVKTFCTQQKLQLPTANLSIKAIFQDSPRGKGNAIREGLEAATGDIILIQDSDLEYDVNDYPALLEPIIQGKADLVLGSRHLGAGSWKIRKFEKNPIRSSILNLGGIFFHAFFNILYNQRITDPTTMFKVFRKECLEGVHLEANRFDFDFEILGKLLLKGYVPFEVPVSYVSRGFTEGKKIHVFRDPLTWVVAITKYRFISVSRKDGFLEKYGNFLKYLLLTLMLFSISGGLLRFLGGPLKSPDSFLYEETAIAPWTLFGQWHPAGVSFLLFFGSKFGLDSFKVYQLLAALLCVVFFYILERGVGKKWAALGLLTFFLDPSWLMLRGTLWSELPFVFILSITGVLLSFKQAHWPSKVLLASLLFIISTQVRQAGIFILPALALGLGFIWTPHAWVFRWKNFAIAGFTLLMTWFAVNRMITGKVMHATHDGGTAECKALIVSLNSFPYCSWNSSLPICEFDPEKSFLNNPTIVSNSDLQNLHYGYQSPIQKFSSAHPEEVCATQREILKLVLSRAPLGFVSLMAKRTWNQFGPWGWTERSAPRTGFMKEDRIQWLDRMLEGANQFQVLFQIFLVVASLYFLMTRNRRPELIYFWLGGLGHAIGISLVNPFLALRYMAIPKYCILICAVYVLFDFFSRKSFLSKKRFNLRQEQSLGWKNGLRLSGS